MRVVQNRDCDRWCMKDQNNLAEMTALTCVLLTCHLREVILVFHAPSVTITVLHYTHDASHATPECTTVLSTSEINLWILEIFHHCQHSPLVFYGFWLLTCYSISRADSTMNTSLYPSIMGSATHDVIRKMNQHHVCAVVDQ
ncbi:uncharacterized protein LOC118646140 [Monomorium pharaonis]|uniref:uncharacterized protein LOC118646140 n=1 Tax=Monomorium pharaonis TaxID=307658 RepID=UPI001746921E|nr:uncharacterized protein LOC118646140 [Monomorium pharaonis]